MTAELENTGVRAIVVVSENPDRDTHPTYRLLSDLGHDVASAASPDEAIRILNDTSVDLLVVDLPTVDQKRRLFERLAAMPREARPRRVAVFAEEVDDYVRTITREQENSRVHVFLKPLHVHGLLNVLRMLEGRRRQTA